MLRDPNLSTEAKANLKVVNRSGQHLLHMINDILDLAKIEAGRVQLKPGAFDLHSFLSDLEAMFRLRAEAKAIQFTVLVGGEPVEQIVADEGRIRQVLINLLGNALNFTERGRISLLVQLNKRTDSRLWLSARVDDSGYGITPEEQGKLFQPFVQGQASQRVGQTGTGLGLAITQQVARLMGGNITVSSTPGVGSSFLFETPVERASGDFLKHPARQARVLGLQSGQHPHRILIADDVPDNREWLSKLLTALGFSVRSVENGQEAVRVWEEWNPQLILMDKHMPVMDGLEATRHIRSHPAGKETVIIALTADAIEDSRVVPQDEVSDFISKPCTEGELLEKIGTHLGFTYVYEDETSIAEKEAAATGPLTVPSAEQMRGIPADLIGRLQTALLYGDKALLDRLLVTTEEKGYLQSARALRQLADGYEYDRLIELLEKAAHPTE